MQPRKGKAQETEKNWSEKEMKIGVKKRRAEENAFAPLIHGRSNDTYATDEKLKIACISIFMWH